MVKTEFFLLFMLISLFPIGATSEVTDEGMNNTNHVESQTETPNSHENGHET